MNLSVNINVCRVCMQANSGVSLLGDTNLKEKFVFTTRLKTSIHDDLPALICNKCQTRLRISYNFIKLAHESEKNLKSFLAKINKDFQLVASNTKNKDKINENENEDEEDELLSSVLDEDNDRASRGAEETNKRLVTGQSSSSTTSMLAPIATKRWNKSIDNAEENQKQPVPKKLKSAVEETREIVTNETNSELADVNVKKEHTDGELRDYELQHEVIVGLEETNLKNFASAEIQNPTKPEHEIEILDYIVEDSQVELEILEENLLQQFEDAHSSCDGMERSTPGNDGFLLEESDESEEDNNAMRAERAASTSSELPLYEASEELLDTGDDNKGKNKRSSVKTNARGTADSGKTSTKVDTASISKRLFCAKINRNFSTKNNITRHMISHEGMRPYQCNVCNKSFTQNVTLKQHKHTHTGEKPYQCEFCDCGFTQSKSLVFHLRRHTGEKPFPSEKCCRQKDGLKTCIMKRTRSVWTLDAEEVFLMLWEEKLDELRGPRKNSHIYKEMAEEMQRQGYDVDSYSVKAKIDNLTAKYRRVKEAMGPTGCSLAHWPLYDHVHKIINAP